MITAFVVIFGLILGSFVNALVWRLREQELLAEAPAKKTSVKDKAYAEDISISKGRSMCPNCKHQLYAKDLVPVLSWLSLAGKCRYCRKPISKQYPAVEALTAVLFGLSYRFWPMDIHGAQIVVFVAWLLLIVGFTALTVYDLKWYLLPNRIVYPMTGIAGVMATVSILSSSQPGHALLQTIGSVAVGGGIFYALFQLSQGKWIGGGDVKLGWVLGLAVGSVSHSFLVIFLAALVGSFVSLPLLATKRLRPTTVIPFGPFLIAGAIVSVLFGSQILHWYQHTLLLGNY